MADSDILPQLLPLAYFGGYVLLPRQLRLERQNYMPLPKAQATTQSFHEDEEESEQNPV
jgi:hypothetical protein